MLQPSSFLSGTNTTDQTVQLTKRDEAMLDWLSVARMADQEAVRWALAALPDGHAN